MNLKLLSWFPKALFFSATILCITLFSAQTADAADVCYVNTSANGGNTGASWADAFTDLQSALGASPCAEIWVAAGTYKPTSSGRAISFVLKNNVALYGGFAGTETQRSQRNPSTHITILSGNIGTAGGADNSYHVVSGGGTDNTAVLDGFTITGGNANGASPANIGGGIYNSSSSPTLTNLTFSGNSASLGAGIYNLNSNPTLMDVTFSGNWAFDGGGIYNSNSHPALTNVTFGSNTAGNDGGGLYNQGSNPTLMNVIFSSNSATLGGGMFNQNNTVPVLTNVTFSNNSATTLGGGMYNNSSNPTLTNVTFGNNSAPSGGGMYNNSSNPTLTNTTFSGNSAKGGPGSGAGGGIYNNASSPTLMDVTFNGNLVNDISSGGSGGGMYNDGDAGVPISLTNVTFSSNLVTYYGGGIYNQSSSLVLTNVTFNGNSASHGGGMYNNNGAGESISLTNVTFSDNSAGNFGGGIYNGNSNPQIRDSIFWDNSAPYGGAEIHNNASSPDLADSVVAGGCPSGATCTNIITIDPQLGQLANNGGFTQTRALAIDSSAVDTGNDATCASADQRGITRPQGAHCDIGAYELINYPYHIYLPLVVR